MVKVDRDAYDIFFYTLENGIEDMEEDQAAIALEVVESIAEEHGLPKFMTEEIAEAV